MLKRILIGATLVMVVLPLQSRLVSAIAIEGRATLPDMLVPGTGYAVVPEAIAFTPAGNPDARRLLMALVTWISANFTMPASGELPHVAFAPAGVIAALRREGLPGRHRDDLEHREVVSVYDDATMTIYLPEGWRAATPAELSILVHELVHHLQNVARLRFACPQEREALAYEAQERWLNLFGRSLEADFDVDPFTLIASTHCGF